MHDSHQPWYRHFWPWFIIGILSASVLGSSLMIYLALSTQDGVVVDYYRKDGLAYREDRARDLQALQLGLSAALERNGDRFEVALDGSPDTWPEMLRLLVVHPTQAHLDEELVLRHLGGNRYSGDSVTEFRGRRMLHLVPPDESWLLYQERAWFPLESPARMYSRLKGP